MSPFLIHEQREYYRIGIDRPDEFELPFPAQAYPCLLWDHVGSWRSHDRAALARAILATDCRYAVCGGVTRSQWHDELDLAFVDTVPVDQSDARFMMTSWHTNESPLEVAWFFAMNTNFDDHDFTKFLVIELGMPERSTMILEAVVRAATDSAGADEVERDAD
ncbi:MAG: hypothetical protein ACKVS9_19260 [Phycisphaerae bacterium]